jgi:uncharacterized protein YjbI with pentapeptide repeats
MLKSANFRESYISKSTFVGANMIFVDMMRVVAKDCNFARARLSNADMREGDFENSQFNETLLYNVNLDRANLHLAVMTDANLDRANISNLRNPPERINANLNPNAVALAGM